jgi:hypothetical protein
MKRFPCSFESHAAVFPAHVALAQYVRLEFFSHTAVSYIKNTAQCFRKILEFCAIFEVRRKTLFLKQEKPLSVRAGAGLPLFMRTFAQSFLPA